MALPENIANSKKPGSQTPIALVATSELLKGETKVKVSEKPPVGLEASGQFRIVIGAEIILVTGGQTTEEWTIERNVGENSKEENHPVGTPIYHMLTKETLVETRKEVKTEIENGTIPAGSTALTESVRELGGTINEFNPEGKSVIHIKVLGTKFALGGILKPTAGQPTRLTFRFAAYAEPSEPEFVVENQSGAPIASRRILLASGEQAQVKLNQVFQLYYDFNAERWTDVGTVGVVTAAEVKTQKDTGNGSGNSAIQRLAPGTPGEVRHDRGGIVARLRRFGVCGDGTHNEFLLPHNLKQHITVTTPWTGTKAGEEETEESLPEEQTSLTTLACKAINHNENEVLLKFTVAPANETVLFFIVMG